MVKTSTEQKKLPPKFTHTLHERVRVASHEYRKLLIGFSAGGLALVFTSLTEKTEPALTPIEKWVCGVGLVSFGLALLSGLVAWRCESEKNYYWAHELNEEEGNKRKSFAKRRCSFTKKGHMAVRSLTCFFGIGVFFLIAYGVIRLKSF